MHLGFFCSFFLGGGSRAATIAYGKRVVVSLWRSLLGNLRLRCMDGTHLIEDILQLVLRERRTLHVLDRTQLLRHSLTILLTHWRHTLLCKLLTDLAIVTEIGLSADDEAGDSRAVVVDFREPLLADVLEGGGRGH